MFDIIKKQNGETFAKAIRNYDNGIFDIPNLDKIVKYAGRQAEPIMAYLVSLKGGSIEEMSVHRNPIDLLDKAGYRAWYVNDVDTPEKSVEDCERDQNAIAGYFRSAEAAEHGYTGGHPRTNVGSSEHGELICTIYTNLGSAHKQRFKDYYIINAVKKEVDGDDKKPEEQWNIKPSDNPEREDEYGTSVISIQILKSGGFISIKNRYNHTVHNPDNTFNSNPDAIIYGLSDALKHHFNVDFSSQMTQLPRGYTLFNDQIFKYVREIEDVYFGVDSAYVKNGVIHDLDKSTEFLIPGIPAILNTKKCEFQFLTDDVRKDKDTQKVADYIKGKKVQIVTNKQDNTHDIYINNELFIKQVIDTKDVPFLNAGSLIALIEDISPKGSFDFSDASEINLRRTDVSDAKIKYNSNAENITISLVSGLSGTLDFSGVKELNIHRSNLSHIDDIKFNPNAEDIEIKCDAFPDGNAPKVSLQHADFSNVKTLFLRDIDVSGADIKFNPNAQQIILESVKGLSGYLDFGNVKSLRIEWGSGFDNVKGINLPPKENCYISGLSEERIKVLQQSFNKRKNLQKVTKNLKMAVAKSKISKPKQPLKVLKKANTKAD